MIKWTLVSSFNGDRDKMELELIKQSKRITEGRDKYSKMMLVYVRFVRTDSHYEIRFGRYNFNSHEFKVDGMSGTIDVLYFAKANEPL